MVAGAETEVVVVVGQHSKHPAICEFRGFGGAVVFQIRRRRRVRNIHI